MKLSERAWERFARSNSIAVNIIATQVMIRQSIFRITLLSSPHVHLAFGSNLWMFSLVHVRTHLMVCAGREISVTNHREVYTEALRRDYRKRWAIRREC